MSPYFPIEHTSDIAYKITGKTIEELFTDAAYAWLNSVADIKCYKNSTSTIHYFSADSYESLLVDFLSELNYLLLTKGFLCYEILEMSSFFEEKYFLKVNLRGMELLPDCCEIKEEIKAITYHQLEIKKIVNGFETNLVFDI